MWHHRLPSGSCRTHINVCLLTVSDRASQGVYEDLSGPAMREFLGNMVSHHCSLKRVSVYVRAEARSHSVREKVPRHLCPSRNDLHEVGLQGKICVEYLAVFHVAHTEAVKSGGIEIDPHLNKNPVRRSLFCSHYGRVFRLTPPCWKQKSFPMNLRRYRCSALTKWANAIPSHPVSFRCLTFR